MTTKHRSIIEILEEIKQNKEVLVLAGPDRSFEVGKYKIVITGPTDLMKELLTII